MGLDMYLYRVHYVENWDHAPAAQWSVSMTHNGEPLTAAQFNPAKAAYVHEKIGYWRKANQIHAWFVANVQGGKDECQESYVEHDKLAELLDACRTVLADHGRAEELLPTQAGFFFGGTGYDEWYFKGLEDTVAILSPLFAEEGNPYEVPGFDAYRYRASW